MFLKNPYDAPTNFPGVFNTFSFRTKLIRHCQLKDECVSAPVYHIFP